MAIETDLEGGGGGGGGKAPPPNAKGGKKDRRETLILIVIGIVGVAIAYLAYKKNSTTTSTTVTTSSPSGTVVTPYGSGATSATPGPYLEAITQALQALATRTKKTTGSTATTSSATPTKGVNWTPEGQLMHGYGGGGHRIGPALPGRSPTTALQQTTSPQQATTVLDGLEYDVLGAFKATGRYTGEGVTTGAPVYYTWTGNGTPTQGGAPAGASGVVLYTPVATPGRQITKASTQGVPGFSQGYT